jgi:hypothetical protein
MKLRDLGITKKGLDIFKAPRHECGNKAVIVLEDGTTKYDPIAQIVLEYSCPNALGVLVDGNTINLIVPVNIESADILKMPNDEKAVKTIKEIIDAEDIHHIVAGEYKRLHGDRVIEIIEE